MAEHRSLYERKQHDLTNILKIDYKMAKKSRPIAINLAA